MKLPYKTFIDDDGAKEIEANKHLIGRPVKLEGIIKYVGFDVPSGVLIETEDGSTYMVAADHLQLTDFGLVKDETNVD